MLSLLLLPVCLLFVEVFQWFVVNCLGLSWLFLYMGYVFMCMYIYIYIYIYILYIYVYMYACVCMYIYIYISIFHCYSCFYLSLFAVTVVSLWLMLLSFSIYSTLIKGFKHQSVYWNCLYEMSIKILLTLMFCFLL